MPASDIARRLAAPALRLPLRDLAGAWRQATVSARVPGHAALAHDLDLLRRIRGAIGNVLLEGASPDAIAGRSCPWRPPCALDILFNEQGRRGAHGIPKPYALAAERKSQDLLVSVTLFGAAAGWAGVMAHALATALQHRIDWRASKPGLFFPAALVGHVAVDVVEVRPASPRTAADIEFVTPMNAEGDDPVERPATVFARLARRVEGLALWQDVAIAEDWVRLGEAWNSVAYDTSLLRRSRAARHSGRGHRSFVAETIEGTLRMDDLPDALWPLLVIGQLTHVGKGATAGFGRFRVV